MSRKVKASLSESEAPPTTFLEGTSLVYTQQAEFASIKSLFLFIFYFYNVKADHLIINQHIKLYLPRKTHSEALFQLVSTQRDHLSPYVPFATSVNNVDDVEKFIKNIQITNQSKRSLITYLFYKEELIGSVGFVNINPKHASAEMGYWISKGFQGKGIISQSCKKLIAYGFKHFDLNRIVMKIIPMNERSLNIPRRLGFHEEGVEREAFLNDGVFYDLMVFSLLKSEL